MSGTAKYGWSVDGNEWFGGQPTREAALANAVQLVETLHDATGTVTVYTCVEQGVTADNLQALSEFEALGESLIAKADEVISNLSDGEVGLSPTQQQRESLERRLEEAWVGWFASEAIRFALWTAADVIPHEHAMRRATDDATD